LWDDTGVGGETVSLSEGEIVCRIFPNRAPEKLPEAGLVSLPSIGLDDLPVRVRTQAARGLVTFELADLTVPQLRKLIAFLYCRPGQWNTKPKGELRATWEYLRAGLRMYPGRVPLRNLVPCL
jgi:hypothetical protein